MYTILNLQILSSMATQRASVTLDAWGVGLLATRLNPSPPPVASLFAPKKQGWV